MDDGRKGECGFGPATLLFVESDFMARLNHSTIPTGPQTAFHFHHMLDVKMLFKRSDNILVGSARGPFTFGDWASGGAGRVLDHKDIIIQARLVVMNAQRIRERGQPWLTVLLLEVLVRWLHSVKSMLARRANETELDSNTCLRVLLDVVDPEVVVAI